MQTEIERSHSDAPYDIAPGIVNPEEVIAIESKLHNNVLVLRGFRLEP